MICLITCPPEKTLSVGIDVIRYEAAVCGFSSTFSLTKRMLSPCSADSSSRIGDTMRHGPHHSAQKSTTTGLSD
jgi:hypothetical protein